jgi:hypothetical protein
MWHVPETGDVRTGMWGGDLWERDKFKGLGIGGRLILK